MSESILRIVLLVQVVVQSGLSLFFIRRSRAASSVFRRREEGVALLALVGASYLAYAGGIIAYLIEPAWMAWGAVADLPPWWRWIGVGPLVAGTVMAMWGLRTLGHNFAFSVSPQEGNALVRSGPYRWVRHPLYTAFFVQAVGVGLVMGSWFVGLMVVLLWGGLAWRTPIEEEKLIERYGDAYRKYIAVTGRFLPRLKSPGQSRVLQ
jgi:protein-S-isoprenylcysteine O-methyltransferase Ste14